MSEEQAVSTTETDPPQESVVPETTAQDDLDTLLNEYEEKPVVEAPPVETAPEIAPDRLEAVEAFMQRQDKVDTNTALSDAATLFKNSAGEAIGGRSKDEIEGLIHLEAFRNPKIAQAFQDRFNSPEKWSKTVQALGKRFAENATKTDTKSTESWDAVDSAMHSASSSTATEEIMPDVAKMSDQEFLQFKAGLK